MWTTVAVIVVILLYIIAVYNGLIARRNQVREAWATVDTQLKRRYDLIPNLIETVRGAAKHEKETLAELTRARTTDRRTHSGNGRKWRCQCKRTK